MKRQISIIVLAVVLLALLAGAAYASNQAPKLRDGTQQAATAITIQTFALTTGVTPTFAAATAGGDTFVNDGATFFEIKNTGATTNITITAVATYGGLSLTNPSYTIPATTGERWCGPYDPTLFNSSGAVTVNYAQVTGITVGAFKLPRY
jgi:hypothetical protein